MSATTRWVQYAVSSTGSVGVGGGTVSGRGSRGYHVATDTGSKDSFNIGSSNNKLYLKIDGAPVSEAEITLASGSDLDPRFVAKDITEKLHALGQGTEGFDRAQCVWENNDIKIYSGSLGSASSVSVASGTNTAHLELGIQTGSGKVGGGDFTTGSGSNNYDGYVSVSGTYNGFFDETYYIMIDKENPIQTPSKGGSNSYTGVISTGGLYRNKDSAITYRLSIDITNGSTMGAGSGNVPTMSWTIQAGTGDSAGGPVELLFPNYWYKVGSLGLMVKFTDAVFNTCDPAWDITCNRAQYVDAANNTSGPAGGAQYVWASSRGDDATTAITTSESSYTRLGSRGLYIKFHQDGPATTFHPGDRWNIVCTPPQPSAWDISSLNYGNVTVSTESPVKVVMFEIMSGAVEMSTVKFGLQSNGSFSYHDGGSGETKFRFGTVGPANNAGSGSIDGLEWRANVTAADITGASPPSYLYAIDENLSVVADADSSEAIGASAYMGMVADPIWLNIKLGSSEVGANSTINYRIYFDYS